MVDFVQLKLYGRDEKDGKGGVMSRSSTLYLEAADVQMTQSRQARHSLRVKMPPFLAILGSRALRLTQQHIFLIDDWFFYLCKQYPNDQAPVWLQNRYFIPYWANGQCLPWWGLTLLSLHLRTSVAGCGLPVGSEDWLWCNLNDSSYPFSDRNTIWVIVPEFICGFSCLSTWDFAAGGLDGAVIKAVLCRELEAWGEGECYAGLRVQTGRS